MILLIKRILNFYLIFSMSIILIQCSSTSEKSEVLSESNNQNIKLSSNSRELILQSNSVIYYELPETSMIQNPEDYLTFSQPVKNTSHIEKFKTLVTSNEQIYLNSPPKDCSPTYNSALVFRGESKKNIILFSINCAVLYLYNDKLFIDISTNLNQLENNFRMIRSGR